MKAEIRAEFLKQRTTKTVLGLLGAMVGLGLLSVLLHGFGLSAKDVAGRSNQLRVLVEGGESLGAVFAGLLGAMSITGEVRHGTIRPTFLATPKRGRVVAAKAVTNMLTGLVFGLIATGLAAVVGTAVLSGRGVTIHLDRGDYALLFAGGAAAAALWAVIGVGVGAMVRNQVAAIVGIFVWVQIVENLLVDSVPAVSRFTPGALAQAITGQRTGTLHSPALGALLLTLYAAAAVAVGSLATTRRDFA
jgi:ABC-type transport system involved in multi-copper enzyme maturation permease subunit